MDPATLAAAALAAVSPYLLRLGNVAAEESAKSAGGAVVDWIKKRLTRADVQVAVADMETAPEAEENKQALHAALVKALKADPAAAAELAALLPAPAAPSQSAVASGAGAIAANADRASHITIQR